MNPKWLVFEEACEAFEALAEDVSAALSKARDKCGGAHLILSGGKTPVQYLPILAASLDDWRGISVSLSDERWVPVTHPDSNEALIREHFLGQAQGAAFTGMMGRGNDPASDARQASEVSGKLRWPADVTIFGAAPDGHVASLFPGQISEREAKSADHVIATMSPGGEPRLSLSPGLLLATRQVMIVTSGPDKRAALKASMNLGEIDECPARLVLAQDEVPVKIFEFT